MFLFSFLASLGDSGNKVSHHFHINSKEMMSTKRARPSIMVQLLGTKIENNKARNERKSKPKFEIRK